MNNDAITLREPSATTDYTLSLFNTVNTGYERLPAIQGMPDVDFSQTSNENDFLFLEPREEHFMDEKLKEFYKKKGYK